MFFVESVRVVLKSISYERWILPFIHFNNKSNNHILIECFKYTNSKIKHHIWVSKVSISEALQPDLQLNINIISFSKELKLYKLIYKFQLKCKSYMYVNNYNGSLAGVFKLKKKKKMQ